MMTRMFFLEYEEGEEEESSSSTRTSQLEDHEF
jgi:hypothetical protein